MQAINPMDDCDVSAQRQSSLRHFCGWLVSESGSRLTDDSQSAVSWKSGVAVLGRCVVFANRSLGQRVAIRSMEP